MYTLEGTLIVCSDTMNINEKFKKRDLVLEVSDERFPQKIQLQLTQERCDIADNFKLGDEIKATFMIKGREWVSPKGEVKYFNTLEVWNLELKSNNITPIIKDEPSSGEDLPF